MNKGTSQTPEARELAPQSIEGRRAGVLAMADFHIDEALSHTYPDIMQTVMLEVNGEAPGYAGAAAEASSFAARQAIQETVVNQRPELN